MGDPFRFPATHRQWVIAGMAALVGLMAGGLALNLFTRWFGGANG